MASTVSKLRTLAKQSDDVVFFFSSGEESKYGGDIRCDVRVRFVARPEGWIDESIVLKGKITPGFGWERNDWNTDRDFPRYTSKYSPTEGTTSMRTWRFRDALRALPANEDPTLCMWLDAGTNPLCVEAGLHGDHLYLIGEQKDSAVNGTVLLLDTQISKHNSARFGNPY